MQSTVHAAAGKNFPEKEAAQCCLSQPQTSFTLQIVFELT
jgi:hypothetical protein